MQSFWILPLTLITSRFIFHISVCFYYLNLQDVCLSPTHVSFSTLARNLVYITCKDAISPDLIYYIMKGDSVFIRSIYQLDSNTLLVDLSVPTGELDYNLTSTLIEVCNKYFYTYHDDKYILEAYLANNYLEDPRIIQDYSFYLVEGYMPEGSLLSDYQLLFNYYYLAPMESWFYTPLQLLGDNKLN